MKPPLVLVNRMMKERKKNGRIYITKTRGIDISCGSIFSTYFLLFLVFLKINLNNTIICQQIFFLLTNILANTAHIFQNIQLKGNIIEWTYCHKIIVPLCQINDSQARQLLIANVDANSETLIVTNMFSSSSLFSMLPNETC